MWIRIFKGPTWFLKKIDFLIETCVLQISKNGEKQEI